MSIGDINSDAKGSGARFNSGKPDLSLLPLGMLSEALRNIYLVEGNEDNLSALKSLGQFQGDHSACSLHTALWLLGDHWNDCAKVFTFGAKKYKAFNWAKGMPWSVPLACAARHLKKIIEGEEIDPESGELHVGHVFCNIVMLLHYIDKYPEGNDLPPKGLL